jgi:hypothetical protein
MVASSFEFAFGELQLFMMKEIECCRWCHELLRPNLELQVNVSDSSSKGCRRMTSAFRSCFSLLVHGISHNPHEGSLESCLLRFHTLALRVLYFSLLPFTRNIFCTSICLRAIYSQDTKVEHQYTPEYIAKMTRWNAATSTFTLLQLLLTFSSSTTTAAFSFRARHDGKPHKNYIHRDINGRQEINNAPFAELGVISDPGAGPAPTLSLPLDGQFETISAINANGLGGPTSPSTTGMGAARSNSRATITSFAPPVFPSIVLQIPIYTICPDTPGYVNATLLVVDATVPYSNITAGVNATDYLPPALSALPVPFNATALLSNGSYTAWSQSLSTPASPASTSASIIPAPDARIILGTNGCQTLYSALTTQICSTVITRGGQVPISVTDCGQWVTFSSSSATAALICNGPNIPATNVPTTAMSPASQTVSGRLISETVTPAPDAGSYASVGLEIAFYAAPWYEIAGGLVPGLVQVANCPDKSANNCSTASESWSVSTSTSTTTSTRILQYAGVCQSQCLQ